MIDLNLYIFAVVIFMIIVQILAWVASRLSRFLLCILFQNTGLCIRHSSCCISFVRIPNTGRVGSMLLILGMDSLRIGLEKHPYFLGRFGVDLV